MAGDDLVFRLMLAALGLLAFLACLVMCLWEPTWPRALLGGAGLLVFVLAARVER